MTKNHRQWDVLKHRYQLEQATVAYVGQSYVLCRFILMATIHNPNKREVHFGATIYESTQAAGKF